MASCPVLVFQVTQPPDGAEPSLQLSRWGCDRLLAWPLEEQCWKPLGAWATLASSQGERCVFGATTEGARGRKAAQWLKKHKVDLLYRNI